MALNLFILKKQCDIIKVNNETNKATCTRRITYINNQNKKLPLDEPLPIFERFPSFTEQDCFIRETVDRKNEDRKAIIVSVSGDIKELKEYSKLGYLYPNGTHVVEIDYQIYPLGEILVSENSFNNFRIFNWEFKSAWLLQEYKLIFEVYEEPKIAAGIISKLKKLVPNRYTKRIEIYSNSTHIPDERKGNSIRRIFKVDSLLPTGPSFKVKCSYGCIYEKSKLVNFLEFFIPGFITGLLANIAFAYIINKFGRT